eukprot:g422.t1
MRRRLPPTVQFPVIPQSTTLRGRNSLCSELLLKFLTLAMRSIEGESKSMAMRLGLHQAQFPLKKTVTVLERDCWGTAGPIAP